VTFLLGSAVVLFASALALTPFESHDLWWHLRTGDEILQAGRPPTRNLFSFTAPDYPWITHEWLSEVLFAWVYGRIGPDALVALKVLVIATTFLVVYGSAWRESGSAWAAAAATALAAFAARLTYDIRPQLFTYLFLGLCFAAIARHRQRGGRGILLLVPLFCVWANMHSGFIVGLILLALAAATMPRHARAFLGTLALATAAALVTPFHWRGLWFPVEVSRTRLFTDTLTEWFSPDFHSPWLLGFEVLLLVCIGVLASSPARPTLFELGTLLGMAHLALQHQRHVPLFAVAAAPIVARHLACLAERVAERPVIPSRWAPRAAGVAATSALVFLCLAVPRANAFDQMTRRDVFPTAAVEFLRRQPPLRLYNSYIWGGYLIRFCPEQPVFIDGRADAYPHQVLRDYLAIERLQPGWRELLVNYRVDAVVYQRGTPLAEALQVDPEWRVAHTDAVAVVFLRRTNYWEGAGTP
jgi:hypothetical protein